MQGHRSLILLGLLLPAAGSLAQESLCNPCIDPPIRRDPVDFAAPGGTRVLRGEDMRALGVISVADMVNRLPNDIGKLNSPADALAVSQILTDAERALPESGAPEPFGPGSSSAGYAGELEDRVWAPRMEARILEAIQTQREHGLVVRRAEVECRMVTCAVLLVHAADRGEGSVDALTSSLRETLGFSGVNQSQKQIPMVVGPELTPDGRTRTWFLGGYVEILLTGADRSDASDD